MNHVGTVIREEHGDGYSVWVLVRGHVREIDWLCVESTATGNCGAKFPEWDCPPGEVIGSVPGTTAALLSVEGGPRFEVDYTVYEDDNNFMIAEEFTYDAAVTKVAELLDDVDNVRVVTVRRVTEDHVQTEKTPQHCGHYVPDQGVCIKPEHETAEPHELQRDTYQHMALPGGGRAERGSRAMFTEIYRRADQRTNSPHIAGNGTDIGAVGA